MRSLALSTLALALALCFVSDPVQAATRHSSVMHTVKAKKNKNAPKGRKAKRAPKRTVHAN